MADREIKAWNTVLKVFPERLYCQKNPKKEIET